MDSKFIHISTRLCRMAGVAFMLALLGSCNKQPVEQTVSHYTLTGLDGSKSSIQSFRGKLLVLNVWATWCPPCRREMPSLERLSKSTASDHVAVAGISTDQSQNAAREFIAQYGITFQNFTDTPGNVANMLDVHVFPETLLISPDGRILKRIVGERDWNSPETHQILEDIYHGKRSESK